MYVCGGGDRVSSTVKARCLRDWIWDLSQSGGDMGRKKRGRAGEVVYDRCEIDGWWF